MKLLQLLKKSSIGRLLKKGILLIDAIKNYFVSWITYLRAKKTASDNENVIYIDISDNRFDRHLYLFIKFLSNSGFDILLRHRFRLFSQLKKYSLKTLAVEHLHITIKTPSNDSIIISDNFKGIYLSDNYFEQPESNAFFVPHTFHPNAYDITFELESFRNKSNRSIDLFFAGNIDPKYYNNPILTKLFKVNTREQVIDFVKSEFQVENLNSAAEKKSIVIHDSRKNNLSLEELFSKLSDSNFFLAVPGVVMPQCHNIVEAMAVGTIPVTQYSKVFSPPLVDGFDCICFSSLEDLKNKIYYLRSLSDEEVVKMRRNVIDYYINNLSQEGVVNRFTSKLGNLEKLYINAEYRSVELFQAKQDE